MSGYTALKRQKLIGTLVCASVTIHTTVSPSVAVTVKTLVPMFRF